MLKIEEIFDLKLTKFADIFERVEYPWEVLPRLEEYIKARIKPGNLGKVVGNVFIADDVEIDEGTIIEHGAMIYGPTIIGKNCTIRAGAYIRENTLIDDNCVVGHSTEVKNILMFSGAKAAHFNYVADSVIGANVNLGSGTKIANWRLDSKTVLVKDGESKIDTGLRKFGAIIGDETHTGANCVLNPGTVLGKKCAVYPLKSVVGIFEAGSMVK